MVHRQRIRRATAVTTLWMVGAAGLSPAAPPALGAPSPTPGIPSPAPSAPAAPTPDATRLVGLSVTPAAARAGDRVRVTARLVGPASRPVSGAQVAVQALTTDGYVETGWTAGDGTVHIDAEVPRGTPPGSLPVVVQYAGDLRYRPSTGRASLTVRPGGLGPLPSTDATAGPTQDAPDPPAPGATLVAAPPPSTSPSAAPRSATQDALPLGFRAALAGLALFGLLVSFAAGSRASAPRHREPMDRFIA